MRMLRAPRPACVGFSTSFARRMAPAQVPNVGLRRTNCLSFSNPASPRSLRKVPDSPPGMTSPSISSSCSGFLTRITAAPSSSRRRRWASKSPCRARTPMIIWLREPFRHRGHGGTQVAVRYVDFNGLLTPLWDCSGTRDDIHFARGFCAVLLPCCESFSKAVANHYASFALCAHILFGVAPDCALRLCYGPDPEHSDSGRQQVWKLCRFRSASNSGDGLQFLHDQQPESRS